MSKLWTINNKLVLTGDNTLLGESSGGGSEYQAGQYVSIVGDVISVTGVQPEGDYATNTDLQIVSASIGGGSAEYQAGQYVSIVDNTISVTGVQPAGSYATESELQTVSAAIPAAPGTLNTNNSSAQAVNSSEALSGNISLHKVSKTGSYSDLNNKPTIPSAPGTLNTNNSTAQTVSSSEALSGTVKLHKVSKTGSYSDLLNQPSLSTFNTANITDIQVVNALPSSPTANVMYLVKE